MICSKCGKEFQLLPNKPGFANVCMNCTESPAAHIERVVAEARLAKEKAAAGRKSTRNRENSGRKEREREALVIELMRRLQAKEPLTKDQMRLFRSLSNGRKK